MSNSPDKMSADAPLSPELASWVDPSLGSTRGTEKPKDPDKGYIALLGWSLNAVKAAQ
ncbi:hypothetical protein [Haliea atlantica]